MSNPKCVPVLAVCLLFLASAATADSAKVWNPINGHWYQRFDVHNTWSGAKAFCEARGGYLATLTSETENDFVWNTVGLVGSNQWLGATDGLSEGAWKWITGEPWSYQNWGPTQPDNQGAGQDHLAFWGSDPVTPNTWDDDGLPAADVRAPFICEWDSPDIKINGVDKPTTTKLGDPVIVTVNVHNPAVVGQRAELWMLAYTPFGWFWADYVAPTHVVWRAGINASFQGPFENLPPTEILNAPLPLGPYSFYFGMDRATNSEIDDDLFFDVLMTNVVP